MLLHRALISHCVLEVSCRIWLFFYSFPTSAHKQAGQALVEYVLMIALLAVFGQWLIEYFIGVLTEGSRILSFNLSEILHTGVGWE